MSQGNLTAVLHYLHRILGPQESKEVTDAELLERYLRLHDEAAFELLVWRHGPMVLGVCRRVLHDCHEIEDSFQATWLTLARKAGSIGKRESLASWLYKVAYRIALRARAGSAQRACLAKQLVLLRPVSYESHSDLGSQELRSVLDEELNRLPEKYRAPVVLCYLQGKTNEEAAQRLCWPVGTLKTRLARARALLSARLTRRGLALSGGFLTAALAETTVAEAVPAVLLSATVHAAVTYKTSLVAAGVGSTRVVALTQGVIKAMFLSKLKVTTAVLLALGIAGAGAGLWTHTTLAGHDAGAQATEPQKRSPLKEKTEQRQELIVAELNLRLLQQQLKVAEDNLAVATRQFESIKTRLRSEEAELDRLKQKGSRPTKEAPVQPKQAKGRQQPVAYIFDTPITREELGEYLLERLGAERLNNLVNQRIIEEACRRSSIDVSEEEVDAAFAADAKALNLDSYHKTAYEWKQDVIRPRLLLAKLCRPRVQVTETDLCQAFEARYGEKVRCEIRIYSADAKETAARTYDAVRTGLVLFDNLSPQQKGLAARPNETQDIARFSTGNEVLEKAALALKPGDVALVSMTEGHALIKCVKRIAADDSVKLEDVRACLGKEVLQRKIQQDIPKLFKELREQAKPRLMLP